jgi:kumamolisin
MFTKLYDSTPREKGAIKMTRNRLSMKARVAITFFVLALIVNGESSAQAPTSDVKIFTNSIVPLPPHGPLESLSLSNEAKQRRLAIHFSLETRNQDEKEARVLKGELISPTEMKEKYSGSEKDFGTLVAWLKSQGFQITRTTPDFANVYATATISQIEKTLRVKMVPVTYNGITTPNAATPPQLPNFLGDHVTAILGLQPYVQAVKHSLAAPSSGTLQGKPQTSTVSSSAHGPFMIHDILTAYNADSLGASGTGQVIAILIETLPSMEDLKTFWQKNHLAVKPSQIQFINVQGEKNPLLPPQGEESLDAEWASGIAPGATVRVYASGSLQYLYLDEALDQIYADAQTNPGLRQVSISLGLREDLVSAGEISSEHAKFLNLAAIGVTVFVSSGDSGSNPDRTGKARSVDSQVEYEASDPFTVAVGGTSLQIDSAGKPRSEVAWGNSGGGISTVFERPTWQDKYKNVLVSKRGVPDVSSVADPTPGAFIWLNGKEARYGGTSWSTPVWAAFCALLADARKKPLGFIAPVLYGLPYNGPFRDITIGSNGAYKAGSEWDAVTGLGVPNLKALLNALPK